MINEIMIEILNILHETDRPMSSREIYFELGRRGYRKSERTIRYYLKILDDMSLITRVRGKGEITDEGRKQLLSLTVDQRLSYVVDKIYREITNMDFDLSTLTGKVIVNKFKVKSEDPNKIISIIKSGGEKLSKLIFYPYIKVDKFYENIEIINVSSNTLYGILMKRGIPVDIKGVGLLEIKNGIPTIFTEIIQYGGITLNPSLLLITAGMTSVTSVLKTGSGEILATYSEIPYNSISKVKLIVDRLRMSGINGLIEIKDPGYNFGIRTPSTRGLIICAAGTNLSAYLWENGFSIEIEPNTSSMNITELNTALT